MALAVVEADRLDRVEALQRPGQAGGRILPAGKQDEGLLGHGLCAGVRRSLVIGVFLVIYPAHLKVGGNGRQAQSLQATWVYSPVWGSS